MDQSAPALERAGRDRKSAEKAGRFENHEGCKEIISNRASPKTVLSTETKRMKTVALRAEGDIDFDAAAREHRSFLLQIAVASTRNTTDAEDVVQEALMRGYRGIKRFRGDCPLRIWLSRIVVRVAINHHRSLARRLKRWVFFADLNA